MKWGALVLCITVEYLKRSHMWADASNDELKRCSGFEVGIHANRNSRHG